MTQRILGPSKKERRRRLRLLLPLVVLAGLVLAIGATAGPVSNNAGFEGDDGNLASDGNTDWNSFAPVTWTGTAPYREAHKTFAGWSFTGVEDAQATTSDTAFAGGTKQDNNCATVNTGKAPNKDDLKRAYFADATVSVGGEDHIFLSLAWVRIPQNTTSPSAHIGFEFNQGNTPCGPASNGLVHRTPGDLLVVYDFEGSGTATPTLTIRQWVTTGAKGDCEVGANSPPCWGPSTNLTAAGYAEARVNTGTVGTVQDDLAPTAAGGSTSETLGLNEFGEAIIDLTAAEILDPSDCFSFGKAFAVSRSSGNSATAQMKDLAGPGEVDIRNCGSVIIRKVTDPSPDPTDTSFGYTTTGGLDPATFSLKDGENQDYGDEVLAGSYSVTEDDPSPDFALTDIDCSASSTTNGSDVTTDLATRTVSFDLAGEDAIDCTFTNTLQQGALKILKNSTKGGAVENPGAVFSYDGSSVTDNGTGDEDSDVGEVCVSGLTPGSYTVNETSPPSGYGGAPASEEDQELTVASGTNCTDNEPGTAATATFTNPPLADIQVRFRDGGSGETFLDQPLSCNAATGTSSSANTTGWDDTLTISGIEVDNPVVTITCTIEIDP